MEVENMILCEKRGCPKNDHYFEKCIPCYAIVEKYGLEIK